jgi:hypothetical protein
MSQNKLSISLFATVISIIVGCMVIWGNSVKEFDERVKLIVNRQLDNDYRIGMIPLMNDRVEDIQMMMEFMNKDNPEYIKMREALEKAKKVSKK